MGYASLFKTILKSLPTILMAGLGAAVFILFAQKEKAQQQVQKAKDKLATEKKVREVEQKIASNKEETVNASRQEHQRQNAMRARNERPSQFGDSRLHDD